MCNRQSSMDLTRLKKDPQGICNQEKCSVGTRFTFSFHSLFYLRKRYQKEWMNNWWWWGCWWRWHTKSSFSQTLHCKSVLCLLMWVSKERLSTWNQRMYPLQLCLEVLTINLAWHVVRKMYIQLPKRRNRNSTLTIYKVNSSKIKYSKPLFIHLFVQFLYKISVYCWLCLRRSLEVMNSPIDSFKWKRKENPLTKEKSRNHQV
jgi:hypothetical protein